ncbi:MAG: DNA-binding response regulator [Bacteroidetes bacterium CG23_combo_of_CG06-09_8_20_14_all_32_9]|nr:MAG: DNA-binding response regulator [Bacteroidetes bacterium CG23_combo_of_CG06-09_8_20_14_all_32_9]
MNEIKNSPVEVMIVDDHQMFIDGIKLLLSKVKNIKIVAEALNGKQALEVLYSRKIDIVMTDISMPEMSGVELTRLIKKEFPQIKVLVVTMYNDYGIINEIIHSEAEGYILKNTGTQELINAITKISDNGTYYCNEMVSILMDNIKIENKQKEQTKNLTSRELEILKLICQEYSSSEIASKLFISKFTVDTHRKHILHKTNSGTLVGLIKFAIFNRLI